MLKRSARLPGLIRTASQVVAEVKQQAAEASEQLAMIQDKIAKFQQLA